MLRAAIYARFSTDLQNEKSAEDQIDLCTQFAARNDYTVTGIFQDRAKSGASIHGRADLKELLEQCAKGRFDIVIVEALDRLSRDMGDMASIHKHLQFANVRLIGVHEGEANTLTVGLRGLVGQMQREDNVHKIRRGMSGLVRDGLSAGGKVYGYASDPINRGHLIIVEKEATIVRRIFDEYSGGKSPKCICHDLNREGVSPPRGKRWSPSALNGLEDRGAGILRNTIYVGQRSWNKVRMVKDPSTGRRVSRPNPSDKWQISQIPSLRLVDDEVWERVQARLRANKRSRPETMRRPKRLLSGLLACGACGAGMSTAGKDKSGRVRLRCSAHSNSGSCPAPRTYYLEKVEALVLDSLAYHLDEPDLIIEYFKSYEDERRRLNADRWRQRSSIEERISTIDTEVGRLVEFVAKGVGSASIWGNKVDELIAQKAELETELSRSEPDDGNVALHPTAIQAMANAIVDVRELLDASQLNGSEPAAEMIREALERVTIVYAPEAPEGFYLKVDGKLDAFTRRTDEAQVCVTLVAEEGLEPPTRGL